MKQKSIVIGAVLLLLLFSCKKEAADLFADVPRTGTRVQLTLDSIFLYATQVYLWRDALPSYARFSPRSRYETTIPELLRFQQEVFDITQIPRNPGTGLPYEYSGIEGVAKYSFVDAGTASAFIIAGILEPGPSLAAASLLETRGGPVGYIALNAFQDLSICQQSLDSIFSVFAKAVPEHLIVDLRDNGGGYIATAQYVADLIANPGMQGKRMFSEVYNALLQQGGAFLLKGQPYLDGDGHAVPYKGRLATMADVDYTVEGNTYTFSKKGNLNTVQNLYFIVSERTASAAEMLISVLKPYMNVKLVGQRTYGKPVGFFGLNIGGHRVYLTSLLIKNAVGWSDYFEGLQPDVGVAMPRSPALGDPSEPCLNKVLDLINGSLVTPTAGRPAQRAVTAVSENSLPALNLMIENRLKLKR